MADFPWRIFIIVFERVNEKGYPSSPSYLAMVSVIPLAFGCHNTVHTWYPNVAAGTIFKVDNFDSEVVFASTNLTARYDDQRNLQFNSHLNCPCHLYGSIHRRIQNWVHFEDNIHSLREQKVVEHVQLYKDTEQLSNYYAVESCESSVIVSSPQNVMQP